MNKNAKLLNSLLSVGNTKPTDKVLPKAKKKKVAKKKKSAKAMAMPGMMMAKKGKC